MHPRISYIFGSSRNLGGANKGLGEAPKSCTRKEHESATNSIAKRGQGAIAPCRVKGQRPLWGLGQRPNCSAGDQHRKRTQQRRRQRSVPAPNFARPQTRPQAALPTRVREEPLFRHSPIRFGHKKKSRFFNQLFARCHPDLNWRMKVLQTFALPLGYGTIIRNGAVDGARTRDLHLGKVALYQLSYYRIICVPWGGIEPPTRRFSVCCSTD